MKSIIAILMILTLTAPASFSARAGTTVIDETGHIFHSQKKTGTFNLPPGEYNVKGVVTQLPMFLQPAEVYQNIPNEKTGITWEYGDTPEAKALNFNGPENKASFYPHLNKGFIDRKFIEKYPKYVPIFLMGHEDCHTYCKQSPECRATLENYFSDPVSREKAMQQYYGVEHQCDVYSRNKMIRNGYNDDQVIKAMQILLDKTNPRIQMMKEAVHNSQLTINN